MLIAQKIYYPSFFPGRPIQESVCHYFVLSINDLVGDCAVYQGIGPDMSMKSEDAQSAMIETVKRHGNKISGGRAREMFPEIDTNEYRYRR